MTGSGSVPEPVLDLDALLAAHQAMTEAHGKPLAEQVDAKAYGEFIAAAVRDVPALVAEVKRQRERADHNAGAVNENAAMIVRLREALQAVLNHCEPSHRRAKAGVIEDDYKRGSVHALDDVYRVLDAALGGAE